EQAHEFGLTPKQALSAPGFYLATAHAIGLEKAQGLLTMQSWYWDSNAETRAWAQRFFARRQRMPNDVQAADYSAVGHYLRAVAKTGTAQGRDVIAAMRAAPVKDVFTQDGTIRADNKMVFTRDLMRVKTPAQSHGPWDLLELVATVPPDQAFRPLNEGGCPMVKT
ncbi:MAG TPA: ABC transporter substrate-binding protein, partial [Acetobacteraceae bacterium]|nr:ABC transporter substrate-binding protein [Acetobacteraceae bacterium]